MLRAAKKASEKKAKGRTGWPQTVWASELKTEKSSSPPSSDDVISDCVTAENEVDS